MDQRKVEKGGKKRGFFFWVFVGVEVVGKTDLCGFLIPEEGACLRAAFAADFLGAFPPVDLRAVLGGKEG